MKRMKKLIAVSAALLMMLSSASVFAAEEQAAIDVTLDGPKAVQETEKSSKKQAESVKKTSDKAVLSGEYMTAGTINYSTSKKGSAELLYADGSSSYSVYSIAVKETGKLYVDVKADSGNKYGTSVVVGSFDGSTITSYEGKSGYVSPDKTETGIGYYDVKKGGTYYVGIKSSAEAYVAAQAYVVPYSTRTLPAGKTMVASGYKGNSYTDSKALFKIKPTKTGVIAVGLKEYGVSTTAGYVTLLNSKKKVISDKLWYYQGSKTSYIVFGVKKGTTYYLKATDLQGSYSYAVPYAYGISYKVKAAAYKKNLKKGKSLKLKRKGKAANMARPATGKKMNQWYKFKVPKKQKTVLKVNAANIKSGTAKLTLYCGKKKVASTSISNGYMNTLTITYGTTYGKANKGTYYAVITTSAKCSGQYAIKYAK